MQNELVTLGIDIGGTGIEYGIVNSEGKILYENDFKTSDIESAAILAQKIYSDDQLKSYLNRLKGIGIGAPNGNFYHGTIEFAPNLKWEGIVPLRDIFNECFKVPVVVTNDANAAAIGEMKFGNAQDLKDFVTVTLGTGVGSGVISDGQLIYGHDGFAGEFGHIRIVPEGRVCGCGRKGCLETYASSTGVVRSIEELPSKNKSVSILNELKNPTAKDVFDAANEGDLFAKEIVDFTCETLGNALADFCCFSSPKAFVLFGGIAQSEGDFVLKVKKHMEKNLLKIYKNKVEVRISTLHDVNAAVLGAASLIR
jgi:glucokinase